MDCRCDLRDRGRVHGRGRMPIDSLWLPDETFDVALALADHRMYEDKQLRREVADQFAPQPTRRLRENAAIRSLGDISSRSASWASVKPDTTDWPKAGITEWTT